MEKIQVILNHAIHLPLWVYILILVATMVICYLKGYHDGTEEKKYMDD